MIRPSEIVESIKATAEICGSEISEPAAKAMVAHLKPYGSAAIVEALFECQRKIKGKLALVDIINIIEARDGRPGPDEAWNIAYKFMNDEQSSVLVNNEIESACYACSELMAAKDKIAARMAFLDAYKRLISEGRNTGSKPKWRVSVGLLKADAADVAKHGLERGLLTRESALMALPHHKQSDDARYMIETGNMMSPEERKKGLENLGKVKMLLSYKQMPKD